MIVKICGIKNLKELEIVEKYADFCGVVLAHSKRRISVERAKEIISVAEIPVFVVSTSTSFDEWASLIQKTDAEFVQVHSDAEVEVIDRIKEMGVVVMKAFRVPEACEDYEEEAERLIGKIKEYKADYILLDTGKGSGKTHDHRVSKIVAEKFEIFIAGGLTPENVSRVVNFVKPSGVDVSSGVEIKGEKDELLVRDFVKKAKSGFVR
ncbi:Phosphoribosylanthranilate isomerase [Ferroglobus placidus DSM 10642]|uniref:N-(5'-phosphoribosyl)anthranilate isomerase n=1 Tax=Ferroglobus placidus (strain DSM 10642 / AEDII12DO) TaxID=589924 RepID=D3S072_FERPA|nr:phosphoribosylanthranilate isomerase [Ferroglobus placidus]ADC66135.1 Phosphoribosylanthranilate isomerase [Ferroglobus placidus DSM 10642]